jgi:chorismate mutase/prephenate dehydratase
VYDLLGRYGCFIAGEHVLKIEHVLLAVQGTKLEDIRSVYSHEQGLRQCANYLSGRGWNLIPYHNTAVSARFVAESSCKEYAAIASRRAAEYFKLEILAPDIQDRNDNYTRFIIVSAHQKAQSGQGKVSIAFTVKHESGSLHAVLAHFAKRSLNLCKIESRNIPGKSWEYRFYIDFEGEIDRVHIEQVMEELAPLTVERQLLGYYPSASDGGNGTHE